MLKDSFRFYLNNIEYMLLISVIIVLPLMIIHTGIVNYIYFTTIPYVNVIGDVANSFFMVLLLVMAQLPFIQFVQSDLEGEEIRLRRAFGIFFKYNFSTFLFGVLYVLCVLTGSLLFIFPGIAVLILFFLTPYLVVIKDQPARKSWKDAFVIGRKHFFRLLGIILLFSFIDYVLIIAISIGVSYLTTDYLTLLLLRIGLTMVIFPYLVILLTMNTRKWANESLVNTTP